MILTQAAIDIMNSLEQRGKLLQLTSASLRAMLNLAWCEGRDAAAAEIEVRFNDGWQDDAAAIRAIKSPYEVGK